MFIVEYNVYNSITNMCLTKEQKVFDTEKEAIHYILVNRIYSWSLKKVDKK